MNSLPLRLFLFLGCCCASLISYSQDFTNKGKDFWVAYGNHVNMFDATANPEKMQLYMTSDVNTSGTVDIPGIGISVSFTVTANQITTIDIPRTAALLDEGTYKLGIHVQAQKPVVVYSFIYVNSISGATLCLPVNTLGKDYYSVNYTQTSNANNSYSYFDVIATDTGTTTVEITPAQVTKGGHVANLPYVVTLAQGQVYQVLGALTSSGSSSRGVDLTGSRIRSISSGMGACKKIAVFCGSGKISIGCGGSAGTSDNLYQQMYPVSTWGKTYIAVPSISNANNASQNNFYRIFKSDPTSVIKMNGTVVSSASFVNNQYYEFNGSTPAYIESDKPILVAQYFTTATCGGNIGRQGDPEMIYLNPVEQTISSVTLNSMQPTSNTVINEHHINVVCRNLPAVTASFKIDGLSAGSFQTLPSNSLYAYAQVTVNQGTHTLTCDSGFNAIAYGFGNAESYGYSAGTNLKDLYQFVSVQNQYAVVSFPAGCRNSPFKFSMTLPYQPVSMKWVFNGLFRDTLVTNPVADSSWIVNGRTLYRYRLDKFYTITAIGSYPVTVLANNPTSDGCSGEQEINYELQIFDRPAAAFSGIDPHCLSDTLFLSDTTNGNGRAVVRWNWDFGDNSTSVIKSPFHVYKTSGSFKVTFSAITDIGCVSDTISKVVNLTQTPQAAFLSGTACEKTAVLFTDQSAPGNGDISKWSWNFGDGGTSALQNPSHVFAYGPASVSLQVETKTGCKSTAAKTLQVGYLPHVSFGLPDICLNDLYAAFTDSSTIAGSTQSALRYRWQFGDPNAAAANPDTSLLRNPQHKYTAAGDYSVKLTVTSSDGCTGDTTRKFTVNGAVPKADFTVTTPAALCSNADVVITDNSAVNFGKVSRVEIFWNYDTDPVTKVSDAAPGTAKTYTHRYPAFGSPASKTVQIGYQVYSGITCTDLVVKSITLLATPQLAIDSVAPVCADVAPFTVTGVREINSLAGTGVFSGTGISAAGVFNPALPPTGKRIFTYTFTSTAGCKTTDSGTVTVYPVPVADAGPDKTVLEGGSALLDAKASSNSKYLWTPAQYLDNSQLLTPRVTPLNDISYTLAVTSADGCTASDQVNITLLKELKVPNAFSPNGDGINDTWKIPYLASYPGAIVEVYNRYGQKVYSSTDYTREWNGTYNGGPLPTGTYYWIIIPGNGRRQLNGSVTIIR